MTASHDWSTSGGDRSICQIVFFSLRHQTCINMWSFMKCRQHTVKIILTIRVYVIGSYNTCWCVIVSGKLAIFGWLRRLFSCTFRVWPSCWYASSFWRLCEASILWCRRPLVWDIHSDSLTQVTWQTSHTLCTTWLSIAGFVGIVCRSIEGSFPCNISSAIIINHSQISYTQLCIYSTSYMRVTIRDVAAYPIPIQFLTTAHAYLMGQLQVI